MKAHTRMRVVASAFAACVVASALASGSPPKETSAYACLVENAQGVRLRDNGKAYFSARATTYHRAVAQILAKARGQHPHDTITELGCRQVDSPETILARAGGLK